MTALPYVVAAVGGFALGAVLYLVTGRRHRTN